MELSRDIIDRTFDSKPGAEGLKVTEALINAGYEAWWVGGGVRDMFVGEIPEDIDIATSAKPEEVTALFKKFDDSDARLGAVRVASGGEVFEITTYREEHELSDGRYPESVAFTTLEKDAERRDITVNALYWNPVSGELYDPYQGRTDLKERLIRIVGDPDTRLKHDALRLLRVIRFRARLEGQYHPETYAALQKNAELIGTLSGTRCFAELEKILLGPNPQRAFEDLWETDILETLLPELHKCKGVAQPSSPHVEGDVWNHSLLLIAKFTEDHEADVRWAGLLHDIGKPETFSIDEDRIRFNEHAKVGAAIAEKLLQRLECPGKRVKKITWLIEHHMMVGSFFDMPDERKAHWYYHPWFVELLQLFWLDIAGTGDSDFSLYEKIIADYNTYLDARPRPQKPLLDGHEIMEILSVEPGERVGEILSALHDAQVRKEVQSKAEAIAFIKQTQ